MSRLPRCDSCAIHNAKDGVTVRPVTCVRQRGCSSAIKQLLTHEISKVSSHLWKTSNTSLCQVDDFVAYGCIHPHACLCHLCIQMYELLQIMENRQ